MLPDQSGYCPIGSADGSPGTWMREWQRAQAAACTKETPAPAAEAPDAERSTAIRPITLIPSRRAIIAAQFERNARCGGDGDRYQFVGAGFHCVSNFDRVARLDFEIRRQQDPLRPQFQYEQFTIG